MKGAATTDAYFDSSLLVKLYHFEPGSLEATGMAAAYRSVPLSFIAEMELRNTLRALHGRKVISKKKLLSALACVDADIQQGQLRKLHLDPVATEQLALSLSMDYTATILSRTLDILHVASSLIAKIPVFVTADRRQAQLAEATGLEVEFIEIPRKQ